MLIRDVLGIVAAMALFLFALQPQEHAHGGRRREADDVTDKLEVSYFDENGAVIRRTRDDDGDSVLNQTIESTPIKVGWGYYFMQ